MDQVFLAAFCISDEDLRPPDLNSGRSLIVDVLKHFYMSFIVIIGQNRMGYWDSFNNSHLYAILRWNIFETPILDTSSL